MYIYIHLIEGKISNGMGPQAQQEDSTNETSIELKGATLIHYPLTFTFVLSLLSCFDIRYSK